MSLEEIEATVIAYFSPNVSEKEVKMVGLWQNDPNFLENAFGLLLGSRNDHVMFFAASLIANLIENFWGEIDHGYLNGMRGELLKFLFESKHSDIIESKICCLVAAIAFNDWPEVWGTFFDDVLEKVNEFHFTKNPENEEWVRQGISNQRKMLEIFAAVAQKLTTSPHITVARRTFLVQEMQFFVPTLVEFIMQQPYPDFAMPEVVKGVLGFFEPMCLSVMDNIELTGKITEFLFHQFAAASKDTFKCLGNLLLRQKIDKDVFRLTLVLILEEIEKGRVDLVEFLRFVCDFLRVSVPVFPVSAVDPGFFGVMKNVLGFTLTNCPRSEMIESFWAMWSTLLHAYVDDMALRSSAVFLMVDPILPAVVDNLYQVLPAAMEVTKLASFQAYSAWVALTMIKEDGLIEYLAGQPLSSSLCIVLGSIEFLYDNEKFQVLLNSRIPEIIENCGKDVPSSMYAVSKNSKFVHDNAPVFGATLKVISQLLMSKDVSNQNCALVALQRLIQDSEKLFIEHALEFIFFLANDVYRPEVLQKDEYLRLAKVLSTIVAAMDDCEPRSQLIQQIVLPAASLLNGATSESVESGCDLVKAIASISSLHVEVAMSVLWEPLLEALQKTQDADLFSSVCSCFAMTIRSSTWELAAPVFDRFMAFAVTVTGQDEAIVDAVTSVKRAHEPVGQYRQIMMERFLPSLLSEPSAPFFAFFELFRIMPEEQETVIPALCAGIRSCDENIATSALDLGMSIHISDTVFDVPVEAMIVQAIIDALFDQMHRATRDKLLSLLYTIIEKMKKRQQPFEQFLFEFFVPRIDNQSLTENFVASLKLAVTSKESFTNLMNSFLVAAGRANPNEMALFTETVITANRGHRYLSANQQSQGTSREFL